MSNAPRYGSFEGCRFRPPTDSTGRVLPYREWRERIGQPMSDDELANQFDLRRYGPQGSVGGFVDIVKYNAVDRRWHPGSFRIVNECRMSNGLPPLECEHDPGDEDRSER